MLIIYHYILLCNPEICVFIPSWGSDDRQWFLQIYAPIECQLVLMRWIILTPLKISMDVRKIIFGYRFND